MLKRVIADLLFAQGHPGLASRLQPQRAEFSRAAALLARDAGKLSRARRFAHRSLGADRTQLKMHVLLAELAMPGDDYRQLLRRIHDHLRPRTYVEIGVFDGKSLSLAGPATVAIGVDPSPQLSAPLAPNARLFEQTSDAFFARQDLGELLGGLPVDLSFIDGLHHFDFALRDFMNLERLSAPGSTILIHDCYPCHEAAAQRERFSAFWAGDVWRLVVLLKKYRPDLSIHTIAARPSGLCLVRNLNPSSTLIRDGLEQLYREFHALDFDYLRRNPAQTLNLFPSDWDRVRTLLPPQAGPG